MTTFCLRLPRAIPALEEEAPSAPGSHHRRRLPCLKRLPTPKLKRKTTTIPCVPACRAREGKPTSGTMKVRRPARKGGWLPSLPSIRLRWACYRTCLLRRRAARNAESFHGQNGFSVSMVNSISFLHVLKKRSYKVAHFLSSIKGDEKLFLLGASDDPDYLNRPSRLL